MIGIDAAAKAEPDGHTLVMVPNNVATIPFMYAKPLYDTQKDIAPIALVSGTPIMVGAYPDFPGQDVQGSDRLRQGEQRQGRLHELRRRLAAAPRGRTPRQ